MSNFLIDEDTDLLAAEFVLGTLDAEERANAQSLLRMDHGFIAMVRIWERRFGELHLMVEPVEPEAKIWQRIKTKIAEIAPREPVPEGAPSSESAPSPEPAAEASEIGRVTAREREVLRLVAEGYSSASIATRLMISVRTVETHRRNVMTKLGLHSATALTRFAVAHGLT